MQHTELTHLKKLTDDFGVWEHATKSEINRDEGYALDDSARAMIVYLEYGELASAGVCWDYINRSIESGHGQFDSAHQAEAPYISHDMAALSLWALAEAIIRDFKPEESRRLYEKVQGKYGSLIDILRPISYALISSCLLKEAGRADELIDKIIGLFEPDYDWFEPKLTYANALPLIAILYYFRAFPESPKHSQLEAIFLLCLHTLEKYIYIGLTPAPVGNRIWQRIGHVCRDIYGQQPVDAALCVIMYTMAYQEFLKESYSDSAKTWYSWFHGNNIWRATMVNDQGGCADGLDDTGMNENRGAESTILYLLAEIYYRQLK